MKRTALCVGFVALLAARLQVSPRADSLYFPAGSGEWARVEPGAAGWDERALNAALEYAGSTNASGVVVLLDGRILAERRWPVKTTERYGQMLAGRTARGDALEDVASAQKSVVAFLAGAAAGRRQLDLDAPVDRYLGKGWSKASTPAEAAITVRHLMSMTSGLSDSGDYQVPAGRAWRYNTGMYSRMVAILEKATGSDIETLTQNWLTTPVGMSDSKWVRRAWSAGNDAANAIGFVTSARDLARFGLLVLGKGSWNGKDLLGNAAYYSQMLQPSQTLNPSYGLLWWLNGQERVQRAGEAEARPGSLIASAPRDLVAALGALDRKCYVVPSIGLVVTRLGAPTAGSPTQESNWDCQFWTLLMKAAPRAGTR